MMDTYRRNSLSFTYLGHPRAIRTTTIRYAEDRQDADPDVTDAADQDVLQKKDQG